MNRGSLTGIPKISIPIYSIIKFSLYLCHGLLPSYPIFQKKPWYVERITDVSTLFLYDECYLKFNRYYVE